MTRVELGSYESSVSLINPSTRLENGLPNKASFSYLGSDESHPKRLRYLLENLKRTQIKLNINKDILLVLQSLAIANIYIFLAKKKKKK